MGRNIAATYMQPNKTGAGRFYGDNNLAGPGRCLRSPISTSSSSTTSSPRWWRASLSYLRYNSSEPGENPYPTISSPDQWYLDRIVDATQVNTTLTPSQHVGRRAAVRLQPLPEYRHAEVAGL